MKKKGFTLVEVLLTLFILLGSVFIFGQYSRLFYKMEGMDNIYQKLTDLSISKIEELKSGRIYINGEEHLILGDVDEIIIFEEEDCNIEVHMKDVPHLSDLKYVNIQVSSKKSQYRYHLIRFIHFKRNELPRSYDEISVET